MRRGLLALLLLVALLAAGCGAGTPKAVVSGTSVDFGDVIMSREKKDTKYHEFVIKNEGTGDLKIEGEPMVKTLKGC